MLSIGRQGATAVWTATYNTCQLLPAILGMTQWLARIHKNLKTG